MTWGCSNCSRLIDNTEIKPGYFAYKRSSGRRWKPTNNLTPSPFKRGLEIFEHEQSCAPADCTIRRVFIQLGELPLSNLTHRL